MLSPHVDAATRSVAQRSAFGVFAAALELFALLVAPAIASAHDAIATTVDLPAIHVA
jgi:hypothetical protein